MHSDLHLTVRETEGRREGCVGVGVGVCAYVVRVCVRMWCVCGEGGSGQRVYV